MKGTEQKAKVLVLRPEGSADGPTPFGNLAADLKVLDDPEAAISALLTGQYDLFLCPAEQFTRVLAVAAGPAVSRILDSLDLGLLILTSDCDIIWASPNASSLPAEAKSLLLTRCRQHLEDCRNGPPHAARFLVTCQQLHLEVTVIRFQIDTTRHNLAVLIRRAAAPADRVIAVERAGRDLLTGTLSGSDLDMSERLSALEDLLIRYTQQLFDCDAFTVRLIEPRTDRLELVLSHRVSSDEAEISVSTEGNGICGYVAATGSSYICRDISADRLYMPGLKGARSSLTVPLKLHDRVIGVFNIEADRPAAFDEQDKRLAELFATYLTFALKALQLIVAERRDTCTKITRNLAVQIAAPLNDIIADASALMDQYIAHDDLLAKLRDIRENAGRIRNLIQAVQRQPFTPAGPVPESQPDPVLAGKRILVADDEDAIREMLNDILGNLGCTVCTAGDAAEAIGMLKSLQFDVVVSDVKMPRGSGYQVFAAAKDINPDMPVILMTGFGYDPNHSIIRARRRGLAAVLFKPFRIDELLDTLRKALQTA